ncbi:hypothetical protein EJB05_12423, partial [Eragrostis curvula]
MLAAAQPSLFHPARPHGPLTRQRGARSTHRARGRVPHDISTTAPRFLIASQPKTTAAGRKSRGQSHHPPLASSGSTSDDSSMPSRQETTMAIMPMSLSLTTSGFGIR